MTLGHLTGRLTRLGVVVGTTAALSFMGPAGIASHTASANARVPGLCKTGPDARMRIGYSDGRDPNSLSVKGMKALQSKLDAQDSRLKAEGLMDSKGRLTAKATSTRVTINTYVHVITRADGTGGVTADQVRRQIAVLNDAYAGHTAKEAAPTIFRFRLAGLDYTANDDWYNWNWLDNSDDETAKPALHEGGYEDLNLYVANFDPFGLLGYAYYPRTISLARDGVVLLNQSLPGGTAVPYNEGDTATHEVGHWLNLAHTFENGCSAPGDEVADTPYQKDGANIFSCDALDTCAQPGMDPVHNFMSYGTDPCLDQFTKGQAERMARSWYALRAGH